MESISAFPAWNLGLGQPYGGCAGACTWPDADCLEIGNNLTKISMRQAQAYFSWYAVANAPLIISTRIDTLDERLLPILLAPEVIAINQDSVGNVEQHGLPVSGRLSHKGRCGQAALQRIPLLREQERGVRANAPAP